MADGFGSSDFDASKICFFTYPKILPAYRQKVNFMKNESRKSMTEIVILSIPWAVFFCKGVSHKSDTHIRSRTYTCAKYFSQTLFAKRCSALETVLIRNVFDTKIYSENLRVWGQKSWARAKKVILKCMNLCLMFM